MALRQISIEEFLEVNRRRFGLSDPRDKAVINRAPSYFEAALPCQFANERDDLDELKIAFFAINNDLTFGLSLYKHQPDQNGTSLLIQRQYSETEVSAVLKAIQESFKLSPHDILMLS